MRCDTEVLICMEKALVGFLEIREQSPFCLIVIKIQMALVWTCTKWRKREIQGSHKEEKKYKEGKVILVKGKRNSENKNVHAMGNSEEPPASLHHHFQRQSCHRVLVMKCIPFNVCVESHVCKGKIILLIHSSFMYLLGQKIFTCVYQMPSTW